jgi:hypothetical protein
MDIIERLRLGGPNAWEVYGEAADEIEKLRRRNSYLVHTDKDIQVQNIEIDRLRAENERLRAALTKIMDRADMRMGSKVSDDVVAIAREALDHGLPTAEDVRGILR